MKRLIALLVISLAAGGADLKNLPNQSGNGDIDLAGNALVDSKEIQELVGAPMATHYVVVRLKVSPRMIQAIRISPDDFTLVSRKDGERSPTISPSQIAGSSAELQKILESKQLPDTETKEPVEGLLYFQMDGKNKPKDLGLLYKGPAGRLAMDFK